MPPAEVILHLELQGPGSKRPMPLRMLEYQIRLAATYPNMPVTSVVWYVGGAGVGDVGFDKLSQRYAPLAELVEASLSKPACRSQLVEASHVIHLGELDGATLKVFREFAEGFALLVKIIYLHSYLMLFFASCTNIHHHHQTTTH